MSLEGPSPLSDVRYGTRDGALGSSRVCGFEVDAECFSKSDRGAGPMTNDIAAFFGAFRAWPERWRPAGPLAWTCIGGLAIPLWATWPALSLQTASIPTFECIAIIFTVAWLTLSCLQNSDTKITPRFLGWTAWIPPIAFALGETGATVFFLLASRHIGAAEANLISYLWPGLTVGLGATFGLFRLRSRHVAGIVLGFLGAAVLIGFTQLSLSYVGIGLALLGTISWAGYCVFRLKWKAPTTRLLQRGFGLSAGLCAAIHFSSESSALPSISSAAAAAAIGIIPAALANWTWDEGFRKGDSHLLAVMAYATPLCSTALLAVLGLEAVTWNLFAGGMLIVIAGFLSRANT